MWELCDLLNHFEANGDLELRDTDSYLINRDQSPVRSNMLEKPRLMISDISCCPHKFLPVAMNCNHSEILHVLLYQSYCYDMCT